jgi:Na+/H+-dicarboxylate symporter
LNRHVATQFLSVFAVGSAVTCWYFFPNKGLYATTVVEWVLFILQSIIVPNAFLSLLTAVLLLPGRQLKSMASCFFKSILLLWFVVTATLFSLWYVFSKASLQALMWPTFTADKIGLVILVPIAMVMSVTLGVGIVLTPSLHFLKPRIASLQQKVSYLFESVYLLIPIMVFFVTLEFLHCAELDMTQFVMKYFFLSLSYVCVMNLFIFPLLYRYFIDVRFSDYVSLISPVVLMAFLAGDSIAAVPMISHAADQFGQEDKSISRIITMVVICFPWIGELANLIFPIYIAILEQYDLSSVLSILSVGPFFMFTDPYISIPSLLSVLNFSEAYQVTYMTIALLTDHMFEVCEAIAALFVVIRLKMSLTQSDSVSDGLKVSPRSQ